VGDTLVRADPSWRDVYAGVFAGHGISATAEQFEAAFRAAWQEWEHEGPFDATEEASFQRLMALDRLVFARLGYPDLPESFFRDVDRAFRQRSAFYVFPDVIPALDAMQAAGLRPGEDASPRFVTVALEVRFLKPTPVGIDLELHGAPTEMADRKVVVEVSVLAGDEQTASGKVVAVPIPASMMGLPAPA